MDWKFQRLWDRTRESLKQGREVDLPHTRISLDFALRLIKEEGGDRDIIVPAIMLHDVGYSEIQGEDIDRKTALYKEWGGEYSTRIKELHLVEGGKLARDILDAVEYETDLVDEIVYIVRYHEDSFGKPIPDDTNLNRIIVGDADRLFRMTAAGFEQVLSTKLVTKEKAFQYSLAMLKEWYVTQTAKVIAKKR